MIALEPLFTFIRRWPIFPAAILLLLVVCGIFAPLIAPHDPVRASLRARNTPPVWAAKGNVNYVLGADQQGRDVLSRVVFGGPGLPGGGQSRPWGLAAWWARCSA